MYGQPNQNTLQVFVLSIPLHRESRFEVVLILTQRGMTILPAKDPLNWKRIHPELKSGCGLFESGTDRMVAKSFEANAETRFSEKESGCLKNSGDSLTINFLKLQRNGR